MRYESGGLNEGGAVARIWFVRENPNLVAGEAAYEMPWAEIRAAFRRTCFRYLGGPYARIRIDMDAVPGGVAVAQYVVCEVTMHESADLVPGYYLVEISMERAIAALGVPARPSVGGD